MALNLRQFLLVPAPAQAFRQPVQSPHIVGMLRATLDIVAQPQIVAVDLFRLFKMTLIQQRAAKA